MMTEEIMILMMYFHEYFFIVKLLSILINPYKNDCELILEEIHLIDKFLIEMKRFS